jgi:cyclophilin family peptidyl-prolyl cis-trans isomerase/HEAT repeat protein
MRRTILAVASLVWLVPVSAAAQPRPAAAPASFEQKMAWILRLEDQRILRAPVPLGPPIPPQARSKGRRATLVTPILQAPDLVSLLSDPEGRVRRRAAQAIGRVGLADGVAPLAALLASDRDAEVRQMAAFALGLIGHRSAVEPLRAALRDSSPLVQGRAADALGLIGDAASATAIAAMASASLGRSTAAALVGDDPAAASTPAADALRLGIYALTRLKAADALMSVLLDESGQARSNWWPVAYALSRIDDPRSVPALLTLARTGGSHAKAFAARGLGIRKAESAVGVLVELARNWRGDPRPAVSAIRALGQIGHADAAPVVRALLQARDTDPNIRLEAVAALGALRDRASLDALLDAAGDPWPALRAAALRAIKDVDPETFIVVLSGLDADPHASVRAAIVSMLPSLSAELATARLKTLLAARDPAVLPAVIAAIMTLPDRPADLAATIEGLLADGDVMVRAAAATAIGDLRPSGGDRALAAAYRAGQADGMYQARVAALSALARYGAPAALATVKEALADRDWAVRRRAADLLRGLDPAADVAAAIRPAPGRDVDAYGVPALVAPSVSPHVYLETDKGTIEIELAVLDAPLTSENFLALARGGVFSGMAIHRVVANFVVQAGDSRGDGEGGPGYTLRDEINMLPYLRGTVGMALDGPDTGGSQFFITHSPQPHLDGKYTVFGRVVSGMDVVDRLQQWDVIRRVRTWDGVQMVTR